MRKEITPPQMRPNQEFTRKPTGHAIPVISGYGPSPNDEDPFTIPDCGNKAGGQFITPFVLDEDDLPTPDCGRNKQGF